PAVPLPNRGNFHLIEMPRGHHQRQDLPGNQVLRAGGRDASPPLGVALLHPVGDEGVEHRVPTLVIDVRVPPRLAPRASRLGYLVPARVSLQQGPVRPPLPVLEIPGHREADPLHPASLPGCPARVEHVELPVGSDDRPGPDGEVVPRAGCSRFENEASVFPTHQVSRKGVPDPRHVVPLFWVRQRSGSGEVIEVVALPVLEKPKIPEIVAWRAIARGCQAVILWKRRDLRFTPHRQHPLPASVPRGEPGCCMACSPSTIEKDRPARLFARRRRTPPHTAASLPRLAGRWGFTAAPSPAPLPAPRAPRW